MTVTADSFRSAFQAFSNKADYPDPTVSYWLTLAAKLLDAGRWGDLLDHGTMLFAAHNLSLEFMARAEAEVGNQPGITRGPLSSGKVDKAAYTYDTASAVTVGDGHWNLTTYGIRYKQLVRLVGAGPVHIGGVPEVSSGALEAWPGPFPYYS